jgi:hypothetical protein
VPTNLPYTFYDRYTIGVAPATARTIDRRQPLPSAFAARWISGTGAAFDTQYKVWREGFTTGTGVLEAPAGPGLFFCTDYVVNSAIPLVEVVRFDEHENAGVQGAGIIVSPPTTASPTLPETSRISINSSLFPAVAGSTDAGGWTYFNLSNGGDAFAATAFPGSRPYNATRPGFGAAAGAAGVFPRDVSQNWVILAMFAEGRYGVDQDANWLGNGCTPAAPASSTGVPGFATGRIGPMPGTVGFSGVLVCPTGTTTQAAGNVQCTGTNTTP